MDKAANDALRAENARLKDELSDAISARETHARSASEIAQRVTLLEAMLETIPVGVVLARIPDGRIIMGNSRVEEMLRHPVLYSTDAKSYGEWVCFHEDGRRVEDHEYPLSRIICCGENYAELDVQYQRGDESRFWMRIIGRPVFDERGARIGAAVALFDIDTERDLLSQQEILIGELNHRVKNAFTVVKSIVSQSLRSDPGSSELRQTLDRRLDAYAKAHSQLIGSRWDSASVDEIAHQTIDRIADGRVAMAGPEVHLPSRIALALSMAFYELATNALKYGSLSTEAGEVFLVWSVSDDKDRILSIDWTERGGPEPVVPESKGFGSMVLNQLLCAETDGRVEIGYPETGYEWQLKMPIGDEGD